MSLAKCLNYATIIIIIWTIKCVAVEFLRKYYEFADTRKKLSKQAQYASKQNFIRNITIRLCRYSNAMSLYVTTILI